MKIVSQKQHRFLGAVASGRIKSPRLSASKARQMLRENRGIKLSRLPLSSRVSARRPRLRASARRYSLR